MLVDGGRRTRGSRPSRYGLTEEECDPAEPVRLANIKLYAKRVRAGLPIFEEPGDSPPAVISGDHVR